MIQLLKMNLPIERVAISESLTTGMEVNAAADSHKDLPDHFMLRLGLSHFRPDVPASYHHNRIGHYGGG
jgi:hypothetical protein